MKCETCSNQIVNDTAGYRDNAVLEETKSPPRLYSELRGALPILILTLLGILWLIIPNIINSFLVGLLILIPIMAICFSIFSFICMLGGGRKFFKPNVSRFSEGIGAFVFCLMLLIVFGCVFYGIYCIGDGVIHTYLK